MKAVVFVLVIALNALYSFSQELPNLIPPSPAAREFHKYGDYPVSLYTGVPGISVPIYEITSSRLKLPINISYHSAGFKPNDQNGIIGLYWTLNAGGMISRQIKGIPDDFSSYNGLLTTPSRYTSNELLSLGQTAAYNFLNNVLQNRTKDTEYDIFSWGADGSSGSFVLKRIGTGTDYSAVPVTLTEKKTDKLSFEKNASSGRIEAFTIINENGNLYRYGKSISSGILAFECTGDYSQPTTSWLLTEIISADRSDTISIIYNELGYLQDFAHSYTTSLQHKHYQTGSGLPLNPGSSTSPTTSETIYRTRTIKEIRFKAGSVKFNYSTDGLFLNSIEVFNSNRKIKNIDFNRSPYVTGRTDYNFVKLDNVTMDNGEVFKFTYNNATFPSANYLSEDWWGYYNGGSFPGSMCPPMYLGEGTGQVLVGDGGVNREANDNMKSLILNKVEYPSGGTTSFEYEVNKYKDIYTSVVKNAGGLRIFRITNNDGNGNLTQKRFRYGSDEDGLGQVMITPDKYNITSNHYTVFWRFPLEPGVAYSYLTTSVLSHLPGLTNFSSPVYYSEVAEYQENALDASSTNGKIVTKFAAFPNAGLEAVNNAQFAYFGRTYLFEDQPVMPPQEVMIYGSDRFGLQTSRSIYKKVGSAYSLVKRESFEYNIQTVSQLKSLRTSRFSTHTTCCTPDVQYNMVVNAMAWNGGYSFELPPPFIYRDYFLNIDRIKLTKSIIEEIDESGQLMQQATDYWYDNPLHTYATKIIKTQSNGKLQELYQYRPLDKNSLTLSPEAATAIDSMISRNMIAPIIEEQDILSTRDEIGDYVMLRNIQNRTNYKIWDIQKRIIKPSEVIKKNYSTETATMNTAGTVKFFDYDNAGNLLTFSKEEDMKMSYCWGGDGTFPIAAAVNARQKDVFHTSFEYGDGNSSPGDAVTGSKSRTNGFSIQLSDLTAGIYWLTYWTKSGNSWSFQASQVAIAGSYTINLSGQVDEVRLYPSGAQMTTYTYESLVGMTSLCDLNNKVTYYEYDNFGRLTIIRDQDRNVVKKIEYKHYSQQ